MVETCNIFVIKLIVMSKMKEIYIEILNEFDGQIPENFDFDTYIEEYIKEKTKNNK